MLLFGMDAHVRPFLPGRTILRAVTVSEGAPLRSGIFGGRVGCRRAVVDPMRALGEHDPKFVVNWTSCATFLRPIRPFMMDQSALEKQIPRSEKSQLHYSQKWQRTTRPTDHELAGLLPRGRKFGANPDRRPDCPSLRSPAKRRTLPFGP